MIQITSSGVCLHRAVAHEPSTARRHVGGGSGGGCMVRGVPQRANASPVEAAEGMAPVAAPAKRPSFIVPAKRPSFTCRSRIDPERREQELAEVVPLSPDASTAAARQVARRANRLSGGRNALPRMAMREVVDVSLHEAEEPAWREEMRQCNPAAAAAAAKAAAAKAAAAKAAAAEAAAAARATQLLPPAAPAAAPWQERNGRPVMRVDAARTVRLAAAAAPKHTCSREQMMYSVHL